MNKEAENKEAMADLWKAALARPVSRGKAAFITHFNGVVRNNLVRLNPDGSLDPSFDPTGGPDGRVHDIAIQPDGRIVIGGEFMHVNGIYGPRIARLHGSAAKR